MARRADGACCAARCAHACHATLLRARNCVLSSRAPCVARRAFSTACNGRGEHGRRSMARLCACLRTTYNLPVRCSYQRRLCHLLHSYLASLRLRHTATHAARASKTPIHLATRRAYDAPPTAQLDSVFHLASAPMTHAADWRHKTCAFTHTAIGDTTSCMNIPRKKRAEGRRKDQEGDVVGREEDKTTRKIILWILLRNGQQAALGLANIRAYLPLLAQTLPRYKRRCALALSASRGICGGDIFAAHCLLSHECLTPPLASSHCC